MKRADEKGSVGLSGKLLQRGLTLTDLAFAAFLLCLPLGEVAVPGAWSFLSPTKLSFLLLAAVLCATAGRQVFRLLRLSDAWLGLLLAGGLVSLIASGNPSAGATTWLRLAGMSALFVLARSYLGSQSGARLALAALAVAGTACAALGIYQTLSSQTFLGLGIYGPYQSLVPVESLVDPDKALVYRAAGPFRHPNELGLFLVACLSFTMGLSDRLRSGFLRLVAGCFSAAQIIAILYTCSRSAWLGCLLVIAGNLLFLKRRAFTMFAVILGLSLGCALLPPDARHALVQRSGRTQPYDADRLQSWRAAALMAWDHPLTGVGFGAFNERFMEYAAPGMRADSRERRDAHNAFLSLSAEAGLPAGLAFAIGFVLSLALGLTRSNHRWRAAGAPVGYAAALVGMLPILLTNSFQYEELLWLALAWNQAGSSERARDAWIVRVPVRVSWWQAVALATIAAFALGVFYTRVHTARDLAGRPLNIAATPLGRDPLARPRIYFDAPGLARLRERARATYQPEFKALRDRADYLAGLSPRAAETNDLRELARSIPPCALAFRLWERAPDIQQARARAMTLARRIDPATDEDIELAEAAYALALARDWLDASLPADERIKLLSTIEQCARSLSSRLFYYPPAGNHRIVDAACLAVAGMACYGETPAAERWISIGCRELERAAAFLGKNGFSPEGFAYQSYSLEHFFKFHAAAGPLLNLPLPAESWSLAFTRTFLHQSIARDSWQPDNLIVSFGDSPRHAWCGPGHLFARIASITRAPADQWLATSFLRNALDEGSGTWLYALWYQPAQPIPFPSDMPLCHYDEDAGLYLARDSWSGLETVFGFSCRPPLGRRLSRGGFAEPGIGHAQPDANSFVLTAGDEHLVTHPGPTTRKLTSLHNTILVNGRGQAGEGGEWLDAAAAIARRPAPDIAFAEHTEQYDYVVGNASSAYLDPNLKRFVRHAFWLRPGLLVMLDDLEARRPAAFEWLLHTECKVELEEGSAVLIQGEKAAIRISFVWPHDINLTVEAGTNPYADPMYGVREWTIVRAVPRSPKPHEAILAVISIASGGAAPAMPELSEQREGILIRAAGAPTVHVRIWPEAGISLLPAYGGR